MNKNNETIFQAFKKENNGNEQDRLHTMCYIQIRGFTVTQTTNNAHVISERTKLT